MKKILFLGGVLMLCGCTQIDKNSEVCRGLADRYLQSHMSDYFYLAEQPKQNGTKITFLYRVENSNKIIQTQPVHFECEMLKQAAKLVLIEDGMTTTVAVESK